VIAALTWLTVALATVGAFCVAVLALRRLAFARAERKRLVAERRLKPQALALLEGDAAAVGDLPKEDLPVLAGLLARYAHHLSGSERREIAAFFDRHGGVDRELAHLRGRRGWRRATAAFVLGDMASPRAVQPLIEALEDADASVRASAARSLGRLDAAEAVEPLVYAHAAERLPRTVAGQALLAVGPPALPPLRALLEAAEPGAREFAVELVGLLGDAGDSPAIVRRLADSSAEVRAKAARALGRLGARDGTAALTATLHDRIPFVRAAAAHALGAVGDGEAAVPLLRLAANDHFDPARAAGHAAAQLDPTAVLRAADPDAASGHIEEAADFVALRLP
jgi:HEAT repeat protein